MADLVRKILIYIVGLMISFTILPDTALAESDTTRLVDMHAIEYDAIRIEEDAITDSYGKTYSGNVLRFRTGDDAFVSYDLNGAYKEFSGTIVCSTETGSNDVMSVGIFADGEKVYELKGYTRQKAAEPFVLDVTGVGVLSIKTTDDYSWTTGYLYFVDSTFVKSESASSYPSRQCLSDMVVIDSDDSETSNRLLVDSFGNIHNGYARFHLSRYHVNHGEGYALYNLDKKYATFTGCIVTDSSTDSVAHMNIIILLDDHEVYRKEGVTKETSQINFELDVTGSSVLKIEASVDNEGYPNPSNIYVADCILKAHEHIPGKWVVGKEATCTESGLKTQYCTECGEQLQTETIPALGHKPDGVWTVEKDATCNEEGQEVQKCTVCGKTAETRAIEKLPHRPSDQWRTIREATCAEEGIREKICVVCGSVVEEERIDKTEHDFGQWKRVSGSVWHNPIVKERACSACGYIERTESSPTPWLRPLATTLFFALLGGLSILVYTQKKRGLPVDPTSISILFSKAATRNDAGKDNVGYDVAATSDISADNRASHSGVTVYSDVSGYDEAPVSAATLNDSATNNGTAEDDAVPSNIAADNSILDCNDTVDDANDITHNDMLTFADVIMNYGDIIAGVNDVAVDDVSFYLDFSIDNDLADDIEGSKDEEN